MMALLWAFLIFYSTFSEVNSEEKIGSFKWEHDLSENIDLMASAGDPADFFSSAVLTCSHDWMAFVITLVKEDFEGVLYSRGSFHLKNSPCFVTAENSVGKKKDFALKLPMDDCGIKYDEELGGYTTTVVVQRDPELIFPGDVAFTLLCVDKKLTSSQFKGMTSLITLASADPAATTSDMDGALSAMSPSDVVTLIPPKLPPPGSKKEEL